MLSRKRNNVSKFSKLYRTIRTFHQLGVWSLLLLSTPLLLALVWLQSSQSFTETATPVVSATKYFSGSSATTSQLHNPQGNQKLVKTKLKEANTHNPKPQVSVPQKPQIKAQKNAVFPKNRQQKSKAKPHYIAPAIEIRVAILDGASNLAIASSTEANILDANGKRIHWLPANGSLKATANGPSIALEEWQLPSIIWIEPTKGGAVYVAERWYRGRLLLVSQGSTLLAVNYVDLEQYLYSVVGSEMSASAPLEALKAQAIAARSYALVHILRPANNLYDLGASQRWQAYKGLSAEYNTVQAAVSETTGQILSYQGGVVESLYAASQEIVTKVHGGVGMSQTGAYKMAAQGYKYLQILAVYYPGSEVARLELKR